MVMNHNKAVVFEVGSKPSLGEERVRHWVFVRSPSVEAALMGAAVHR